MGRKCGAKPCPKGFHLTDTQIEGIYSSKVNAFSNGGAYISVPKEFDGKKAYVVICK